MKKFSSLFFIGRSGLRHFQGNLLEKYIHFIQNEISGILMRIIFILSLMSRKFPTGKRRRKKNMWKKYDEIGQNYENLIFRKSFSLKVFLFYYFLSPDILLYTGLQTLQGKIHIKNIVEISNEVDKPDLYNLILFGKLFNFSLFALLLFFYIFSLPAMVLTF